MVKTRKVKTNRRKTNKRRLKKVGGSDKPIKSRNCHPQVIGKTISDDSCLTSDILEKIKHKYNEKATEKILTTEPIEIYEELNRKIKTCDSERCLIEKAVKDDHLFHQWIKEIEAPEHPKEWKKNPNEWLSNIDIDSVMKQYEKAYPEFLFISPTSINFDESDTHGTCVDQILCKLTLTDVLTRNPQKRKIGMVFNLSRNDEPGSHWVSLYIHLPEITVNKKMQKKNLPKNHEELCSQLLDQKYDGTWDEKTPYAFFFDSGGDDTPQEVLNMVCRYYQEWEIIKPEQEMSMKYDDNHRTKAEHQSGGTECGMYSLFFIVTMLTGICGGKVALSKKKEIKEKEICPEDFQLDSEQKKRIFFQTHGKRIPDDFVEQFRHFYFNSKE